MNLASVWRGQFGFPSPNPLRSKTVRTFRKLVVPGSPGFLEVLEMQRGLR